MSLNLSISRLGLSGRAGGGASGFVPDFYVDSVNGNDSNAGTEAAPYQTLSKALTEATSIGNGAKIGLVAGSRFEAAFDASGLDNVQFFGVGDLATDGLPVLYGNVATGGSWQTSTDRADANTDVYSKSLTTAALGCSLVFENDSVLEWRNTVAEVQSTPGTFTHSGGPSDALAAGTYTYYIHPFGSTNPNSDGKTYTYSSIAAPEFGDNCHVKNIRFERCISRNGLSMNYGSLVENCVFVQMSAVHEALLLSGEYRKCYALHDFEDSRQGHIGFEIKSPGGAGVYAKWDRCAFDGKAGATQNLTAFGSSTTSALFDSEEMVDCVSFAANVNMAGSTSPVSTRNHIIKNYHRTRGDAVITDLWIEWTNMGLTAIVPVQGNGSFTNTAVISGLRLYGDVYTSGIANFSTLDISRSVFVRDNSTSRSRPIWSTANTIANMQGCAFDGNGGNWLRIVDVAAVTAADNNAIGGTFTYTVGGTGYTSIAAIQAALSIELNSLAVDPNATDPANGDFVLLGSVPANCGLERFPTYTELPADPDAAEAWIVAA